MFLFGCESKDIEKNGSEIIDLINEYNGNTSSDNSSVSESNSSANNDSDVSSSNSSDEAQKDNNTKNNNSSSNTNSTSNENGSGSSQNKNGGSGSTDKSNQNGSSSNGSGNNSGTSSSNQNSGSASSQNQQNEQGSQQTASGWSFSDIDVNLAVQGYIEYVNAKRAEIGVAPFIVGSKISQLAKIRSVEIQSDFSHNRKGGTSTNIFSEHQYGKLDTVSDVPGWQLMNWAFTIDENGNFYEPELCTEVIGLSSFDYRWPYANKIELSKRAGIAVGMGMCGSPGHWAHIKDLRLTACGVGISLVDNKDGTCSVYVSQLLTDKLYE